MPGTAHTRASARTATRHASPMARGGECLDGKHQVLWSPAQVQGGLNGYVMQAVTEGPVCRRDLCLGLMILKFLIMYDQETLCLSYAPGPPHFVANPEEGNGCSFWLRPH